MRAKFFPLLVLYLLIFNFSTVFAIQVQNQTTTVSIPAKLTDNKEIIPPVVVSDSAVLMDANSGEILFQKEMNKKQYPASITKVMTVLLAMEKGNLSDTVTVSNNAVNSISWDSSKLGVVPDEQLSFKDALYAIMIKSANDVSVVIAEHIAGSEEEYCKQMTKRAKELGANDTNFVNAHGLYDENHYVTAHDMAIIAKEAIKHEIFRDIIAAPNYEIAPTNKDVNIKYLPNRHKMATKNYPSFYYDGLVGGKTGFTDQSSHTLVSFAERNGVLLIAVTLKAPKDIPYTDTKVLFDYGFDYFSNKTLLTKSGLNDVLEKTFVPVYQKFKNQNINTGKAYLTTEGSFKFLLRNDEDESEIEKKVILPDKVNAPVKIGDEIGKIEFYKKETLIGEMPIIARNSVDEKPENIISQEKNKEFIEDTISKLPIYLTFVPAILLLSGTIIKLIINMRNKKYGLFVSNKKYKLPRK